jgi:hypothetical protein
MERRKFLGALGMGVGAAAFARGKSPEQGGQSQLSKRDGEPIEGYEKELQEELNVDMELTIAIPSTWGHLFTIPAKERNEKTATPGKIILESAQNPHFAGELGVKAEIETPVRVGSEVLAILDMESKLRPGITFRSTYLGVIGIGRGQKKIVSWSPESPVSVEQIKKE